MEQLAPIVIFVYARPEHTIRMLESLEKNNKASESDVFIFSDNAKNEKRKKDVEAVRKIIHEFEAKKIFKSFTIYEAEENKGLAKSVIFGVTEIIKKYGKVIVLEDDLVLSKMFIEYMNKALEFYKDNKDIWSISGYNLPIEIPKDYVHDLYLSYRGCSWGWATWEDRWTTVDWNVKDYNEFKNNYKKRKKFNRGGNDLSQMLDLQMKGKIDSWAIRWCYEQSKQDKYTIYPVRSFIKNEGLDGTGTHSGYATSFTLEKLEDCTVEFESDLKLNKVILKNFKKMFDSGVKQKLLELIMVLRLEKVLYRYKKWRENKK